MGTPQGSTGYIQLLGSDLTGPWNPPHPRLVLAPTQLHPSLPHQTAAPSLLCPLASLPSKLHGAMALAAAKVRSQVTQDKELLKRPPMPAVLLPSGKGPSPHTHTLQEAGIRAQPPLHPSCSYTDTRTGAEPRDARACLSSLATPCLRSPTSGNGNRTIPLGGHCW